MSFRCKKCGEAQESGVRPNRVVVETRERVYRAADGGDILGSEIVREEDRCEGCVGD